MPFNKIIRSWIDPSVGAQLIAPVVLAQAGRNQLRPYGGIIPILFY